MNNQTPSSSTTPTPQTPSLSNQKGKTQVFILSPDILKKLGIASKIPNLATAKSIANVSTVQSKGDSNKPNEENIKNRIETNLNKQDTKVTGIKNVNETNKYDKKDLPNQQEKEAKSIISKTTNLSAAKLYNSQPNVSFRIDNVQNIVATNLNNEIRSKSAIKNANEIKRHDRENTKPKTSNLITAQTTTNLSYIPTVSFKTDNEVHKIVKNKENSKVIEIASETKIYNDKDPPLKPDEKLKKFVKNVSPTFSLKTDIINKKHVNKNMITNLNEENNKVAKIENATDIKMYANKGPSQKENVEKLNITTKKQNLSTDVSVENISTAQLTFSVETDHNEKQHVDKKLPTNLNVEDSSDSGPFQKQKKHDEKLNITTKIPNLSTDVSVENISTAQLTLSVETHHINEKQHVDNKLPTNLNVEDNLPKIKIVSEINSCNDSGPFQKQKDHDGNLNITTEIPNLLTGKCVKIVSNSQFPVSLRTDNINEEQHVKNKIDTNLHKEVSKVIEIKNLNEIKNCNDIDLSPNQRKKEEKINITIPDLSTSESTVNVPDSQPNISIIKGNLKSKLTTSLNIEKNKIIEIQNTNETEKCAFKDPSKQTEMEENSVKSKLLSMLTAKLENKKLTNASNSPETKTDKQTINLINQLKPKEDITSKLKQTKLFQYCTTKDKKTKSETESHESDIGPNKEPDTNIKVGIKSTTILERYDYKNCNSITQENKQIDTNKTVDNKISLAQSTNLLQNKGIKINDIEHKIINSTIANTNKNIEHKKEKSELESSITQSNNASLVEKSTPKRTKAAKIKPVERSSFEDPETITPIRKSGRKRKLSTLHTDYISELKLHDGSCQKIPKRGRKSTDVKISEICDQYTEKNVNDFCENDVNLKKKKQTEQRKIAREVSVSKNSDKSTGNKIVNLNEKSIENTCENEELETVSISDNTKEANQNINRKSSNKLIIMNKTQLIREHAEFQSNVNKIKSNSNIELNKTTPSNENESNSECTYKTVEPMKSPKKQIIILENILIKSPTKGNMSNLTATENIINISKPSVSKLTVTNSSSKKSENETNLLKKEVTISVADSSPTNESLKVKSPLKTYAGCRKGRISLDSTNTKNEIQSPEMNQTPLEINNCILSKDDVNKLILETDNINKNRTNSISEKIDLIEENNTNRKTSQIINFFEKGRTSPKEFKTSILKNMLNATVVNTKLETTQDIEEIKVKQKANIMTHEKTNLVKNSGVKIKSPQIVSSPGKNITNYDKLNTQNLPETSTSINITAKSSIDQNSKEIHTKHDVISDTTTPVEPNQLRNKQEPGNLQIADADIVLIDDIKDVNIKREILSTLGITTPIRRRKTKTTQKLDSATVNIDKKVDKTLKNVKQDVLTVSKKITPSKTLSIETEQKIIDLPTISTVNIEDTKQGLLNSQNTTASITSIQIRGRQDVFNVSETETQPKTLPIIPEQKVKNVSTISTDNIQDTTQELLNTDNKEKDLSISSTINIKDTQQELNPKNVTASITPIRKRGRQDVLTFSEKITPSKTLSIKTEQKVNDLSTISKENIEDTKQELLFSSENALASVTPIRKRGRQAKNNKFGQEERESPVVNTEVDVIQSTNDIENVLLAHTETTTPIRRRGRKAKHANLETNLSPQRGKKRKIKEIADETPTKSKDVTCGVCNEVVDRSNWNHHCVKHNFLCWKVGEPPLDLNDRKLVEYILYKAVKNKVKSFTCPHCADKKKSVLGFLAHVDMCQLTDEERTSRMATCFICSKKVLPQSMKSHMRIHENNVDINEESKILQTSNLDGSRSKRKAATKAANLIQEVASQENVSGNARKDITTGKKCYKKARDPGSVFITFGVIKKFQTDFNSVSNKCRFKNCTFECKEFDEMKKHLNVCPAVNSDDYICRFCLHVESDEYSIKKHVKDNHVDKGEEYKNDDSGSESYDDDDDDDEEFDENGENNVVTAKKIVKYSTEFKPIYKAAFLAYDRRAGDRISSYLPAIKWTYEFRQKNYSEYIFENIKCLSSNWTLLPSTEHEKYMPLSKKSMSVNTYSIAHKIPNLQNKEHDWKEYSLYESTVENDTTTIFCGGPISALAWVPTPLDLISEQYLAVSLQKNFEATYPVSKSISGHELIHFWNFGPLQSKRKIPQQSPVLEFSIAHNHGMVWCMEWCPSGFYDTDTGDNVNEFRKLGLLALACSDGSVPIYAIGIPHKKKNIKNNIYQVKPVYKLILQDSNDKLLGQWKYQATKISWSKNSGHNVIAGGFSNGMVCLWDLDNSSPLLKSENDGIIILKPYLSFQAHYSVVSALVLYPLIDKGRRWLLSGSLDRNFKYWDLNNNSAPISSFAKRGFITDGVWLPHWLCSFIAFDDIFNFGHNVTTVQNPRDFGFKQCAALASNSVVKCLSGNDWASAIAQGSLAGELSTTFPRTMLLSYDVDKHLKCKRMLISFNDIIDKTKDVSERKDIMKSEKKPEKNFGDRDDKLFSQYLANSGNKESYVEQPTTYEEAQKKFGLLFCDLKLDQFSSLPPESLEMVRQSNRLHEVPIELYPFMSLNSTVWNPNKQAYLYVACGYQNGFVRLRCLRFMNTNRMNNYL